MPVQNVFFGSTPVASGNITVVSSTQLQVKAPAHAGGTVAVTVVTGNGTSNSANYGYQGPFSGGAPPNIPANIICSAYDLGGPGVSWNFPQNPGFTAASGYRSDFFGTLKANTDTAAGFSSNPWVVGYGVAGAWIEFTVNVVTAGNFTFVLRCGTDGGGGQAHLGIDGTQYSTFTVPPTTANWDTPGEWVSFVIPGTFALATGQHVLAITVDKSNLDLNQLVVSGAGTQAGQISLNAPRNILAQPKRIAGAKATLS